MRAYTATAPSGFPRWILRIQAPLFAALIVVEILSSFDDLIAKLGVVLWIASFLWLLILSVLTLIRQASRSGGLFSILAVLALVAFAGVMSCDFRTSSHEATQEIGCVISGLAASSSWDFNSNCFIGYPARQFFLPALPTLLFGRSLVALNLGNLLYLFVGAIAFVAGVRAIIGDARIGDLAAALGIALLSHVGFFPYLLLTAEQSLYPLALSLLCTGLFLVYQGTRDRLFLVATGLALYLSLFSYTPVLALIVLGGVLLLGVALTSKTRVERLTPVFLVLTLAFGLARSASFRGDIRLGAARTALIGPSAPFETLSQLASVFLSRVGNPGVASIQLIAIFGVLSLMSLILLARATRPGLENSTGFRLFRTRRENILGLCELLVVLLWSAAVLVISVVSRGYAAPPPAFAIHRSSVAVPPLLAAALVFFRVSSARAVSRPILTALAIALLFVTIPTGLLRIKEQLERSPNRLQTILLQTLADARNDVQIQNPVQVLISSDLTQDLQALGDFTKYYLPNCTIRYVADCSTIEAGQDVAALVYVEVVGGSRCRPVGGWRSDRMRRIAVPRSGLTVILMEPEGRLIDSSEWKVTASTVQQRIGYVVDRNPNTRWDSGKPQAGDEWIEIDLGELYRITRIALDQNSSTNDYPRGYAVDVSTGPTQSLTQVAAGTVDGPRPTLLIDLPETPFARIVRIRQTGQSTTQFWSVHEIYIMGAEFNSATRATGN